MPAVDNIGRADLVILYTQIGRGHPSYLDGIINRFEASDPGLRWYATDVFSLSHGTSLTAWRLVRRLYRFGGRGGVITALYGLLRRLLGSGEGNGMLSFFLGRDIKQALTGFRGPVLVAHPLLARIIRIDNLVIYQHGELAAPAEAIVPGCMAILVPRRETARIFLTSGIPDEIVHVTGQCVETELLPMVTHAFRARRERMACFPPGPILAVTCTNCIWRRCRSIEPVTPCFCFWGSRSVRRNDSSAVFPPWNWMWEETRPVLTVCACSVRRIGGKRIAKWRPCSVRWICSWRPLMNGPTGPSGSDCRNSFLRRISGRMLRSTPP
jgi:hypothetical protein